MNQEDHLDGQIDAATHAANDALAATQRVARQALEGMVGAMEELRDATLPLLAAGGEHADQLLQQGSDAWHRRSRQLRLKARRASEDTVHYIQDEPVKAVLIAAASGAVLVALASLVMRSRRGD